MGQINDGLVSESEIKAKEFNKIISNLKSVLTNIMCVNLLLTFAYSLRICRMKMR